MTSNLLTNLNYDINLIFASSVDVYGSSPQLPLNEKSPLNPESWYAESKVQCEQLIGSSLTQGASRHVILRLPGVYGNVTAGTAILDQMAAWSAGSRNGYEFSNPAVLRDWVSVRDFYRFALDPHMTASDMNSVINFATGESLSMIAWLSLLTRSVPKRSGYSLNIPMQMATQDSFDLVFDVSLFSSMYPDFSFTPRHQAVGCYLDT
jgi:nucleoside-diphosphate-sugar epimerase